MSFLDILICEFLVREHIARPCSLTWPQRFVVGLLDFLFFGIIRVPIRVAHSFIALPSVVWLLLVCFSVYWFNKVIRVMVLTRNIDMRAFAEAILVAQAAGSR